MERNRIASRALTSISAHGRVAALAVLAALAGARSLEAGAGQERELTSQPIRNGRFIEAPDAAARDERAQRVPWWIAPGDPLVVIEERDAEPPRGWLRTPAGQIARQPFAAFAPLAGRIELRARVRGGAGVIALVDGLGGRAAFACEAGPGEREVGITADAIRARLGRDPLPRLAIELTGSDPGRPAEWTGVAAGVPLPSPEPGALREELLGHVRAIVAAWLERGLDAAGPRATAFASNAFDVVTGQQLFAYPGGIHPLYEHLLDLGAVEPDALWREALERYLADFLELGLHPDTGLPREWDGERDEPLDHKALEVHSALRFLLDAAERGPEPFRGRALDAARRMGETILRSGVMPDGSIAPRYVPDTAAPNSDVPPLRRLNLPAQLARLGARLGDERFGAAARAALYELEYTHHWGGTWRGIDPDFDDNFGTLGAAGVVMLRTAPETIAFRRFAIQGWRHFAEPWRDALRFGGSIAADQVRCWDLLVQLGEVEPSIQPQLAPLLSAAARAHFAGEQYENGAWGDVTFAGFDPRPGLSVGDLSGAPANLLWGLALLHGGELELEDLPREELRAMFTAVLRSSAERYGRPYGWLSTRSQLAGANRCGAELRACRGLIEMLKSL
jgi:hypothetical protein